MTINLDKLRQEAFKLWSKILPRGSRKEFDQDYAKVVEGLVNQGTMRAT